ncbi:MAG TPA: hypothetical protein VG604_01995 [Candidatus Saccharimonadales bacterium]|nr:hypothetical protein [Candidatus Saccharimonadales bacterium]
MALPNNPGVPSSEPTLSEAELAEWTQVRAVYDIELPDMRRLLIDRANPEQVNDEGLLAAASLKAAMNASFRIGQPLSSGTAELVITPLKPSADEANLDLRLSDSGGGLPAHAIHLKGLMPKRYVQALGLLTPKNPILRADTDWSISANSISDMAWTSATFKPANPDIKPVGLLADRGALSHGPTIYYGNIDGDDYINHREHTDPHIVIATHILVQATAQWIAMPEGARRERQPTS